MTTVMYMPSIPEICVSPAPPEEPLVEPYSPFQRSTPTTSEDNESFRSQHLTPPPSASNFSRNKSLSPLRPPEAEVVGKGLARERFEALLQASRDRSQSVGAKKARDLRKDIAVKVHGQKQMQRRALFLSKVLAPPSPTATDLPKTPPESPAIFHYTLPSPGLVSPLALFESLGSADPETGLMSAGCDSWVEQVDFRLPQEDWDKAKPANITVIDPPTRLSTGKPLPSLDQITARLGHVAPSKTSPEESRRPSARLPAFLRTPSPENKADEAPVVADKPEEQDTSTVGRLRMPIRRAPASLPQLSITEPLKESPVNFMPPSPDTTKLPKLQVTTTVVPRISSPSPQQLTPTNLQALSQRRERTSTAMLAALAKRRSASGGSLGEMLKRDDVDKEKVLRRLSSPAEIPKRGRLGFEHPVQHLPGAF